MLSVSGQWQLRYTNVIIYMEGLQLELLSITSHNLNLKVFLVLTAAKMQNFVKVKMHNQIWFINQSASNTGNTCCHLGDFGNTCCPTNQTTTGVGCCPLESVSIFCPTSCALLVFVALTPRHTPSHLFTKLFRCVICVISFLRLNFPFKFWIFIYLFL